MHLLPQGKRKTMDRVGYLFSCKKKFKDSYDVIRSRYPIRRTDNAKAKITKRQTIIDKNTTQIPKGSYNPTYR